MNIPTIEEFKELFFIFTTYEDGKEFLYVRFCPFETMDFRHGLALAEKFNNKDEARLYIEKVSKYFSKSISLYIDLNKEME